MNHKRSSNSCPYEHYYSHQAGSGVGIVYKGVPFQRGHGIGSFLGGLFRSVIPLLSSGLRTVGRETLDAGMGLISDMVNSRPMESSIRSRFKEASSNLKRKADEKIDSLMSGSGYKTSTKRREPLITLKASRRRGGKKNKKYNIEDIFSNK
jgi:hypothetical protein